MKGWLTGVGVAVLAIFAILFWLTVAKNGDTVDASTSVPRGANAPTAPDPEAKALAEALKKAKGG